MTSSSATFISTRRRRHPQSRACSTRNDRSAALMAAGDRRAILHFDWTLFILVLALAGIGLVSVISASYGGHKIIDALVIHQFVWIAVGTGALLLAVLVDYRALQSYAYPFYVLVVLLLIAVMVAGH